MLPNRACNTQLLAFTHALINRGLHADPAAYRALCAAYATLLALSTDETPLLARLFDRPVPQTVEALLADIEALIVRARMI